MEPKATPTLDPDATQPPRSELPASGPRSGSGPVSDREGPPSRDPFNPFTAAFRRDPYPHYRRIRALDPVHWSFVGVWMLTRHADIVRVLKDPARFSSQLSLWDRYQSNPKFRTLTGEPTPCAAVSEQMMIFRDPPAQTRLRKLVQQAFSPRAVQAMRPWITAYVEQLLDRAEASAGAAAEPPTRAAAGAPSPREREIDLIAELAWPLPVGVISEMLGVPEADRDFIRLLSRRFAPAFAPMTPPTAMDAANEACAQFVDYFRVLSRARRKTLGPDLLSALLSAEETGDRLTEAEVISNCFLLFFAGHETTVNLIGNGLHALLNHRDQWELLQKNPELVPNAIEELLRYDSPFQIVYRNAVETVEIGGKTIREGEQLFVFLGSANRDEEVYADPEVLDVTRKGISHLGFGHGIHHCLGAALGRLEAAAAVSAIVRRYPNLRASQATPAWGDNILLRGLRSLPVCI
ncbi:cytochrome P450 [Pendulispora albinea]|uniref:Cytochrome P450 n=1 Tax=Pendulispora albinea TaxID=2741071 RepID=A0ABZ2MAG1_9BACT